MMKARFIWTVAAFAASLLAACGGGGGGSSLPAAPSASPTPSASPSIVATFGAAPSSVEIPSGAGISGTILLPAGTGIATLTASTRNPAGTPVVQSKRRASASVTFATNGNTAVAYVTLTATNGAVTMQGLPGFSAVLPSGAPAGTYFVAYYDTAGQTPAWVSTTTSGASGSGGATVTIPATTSPALTVASGQSIYFAVYYGSYIPPINVNGCVGVNQTPLAAREATRALVGVHPITSGDAYNFSGTLAQTIVRSQPCPQPTATADANVSVAVAMSAGPGTSSIENSTETDAYATHTSTLTTAATVSQTGSGYFESSETATDGNGNTIATTYGGAGLQYGELNALPNNQWSNGPPATVQQTLADGTTLSRIYNPNGSYVETDTIPGGFGTNQIAVNSDESGSYGIGIGTSYASTLFMSAPSSGAITITLGAQTLTIPSWLPVNGTLYSDSTTDAGPAQSLPPECTFSIGLSSAEHLQRVVRIVDPVLGYLETNVVDSYDLPNFNGTVTLSPVCEIVTDTLDQYYDYSWTTTQPWYFSENAQPLLLNTMNETISLQTNGLIANARMRAASRTMQAQLNARESGIAFARLLQRARQTTALVRAVRNTSGLLR